MKQNWVVMDEGKVMSRVEHQLKGVWVIKRHKRKTRDTGVGGLTW